jgi:hypothetical protein
MPSSVGVRSLRFRHELFDESDRTHKRELLRTSAAFADVSEREDTQCPRTLQGGRTLANEKSIGVDDGP